MRRHEALVLMKGIQYLIFWWWTGLLLEVRSPWLCWLWWWRSMWFQDTGQRTGNGFHFLAWKLFHFGWINLFLGQRNWLLCRWSAKEKEHDGDSRGDRCGSRLYPTRLLIGVWGGGGATDLSGETLRRLDASNEDAEEPSPNFWVVCYCIVEGLKASRLECKIWVQRDLMEGNWLILVYSN